MPGVYAGDVLSCLNVGFLALFMGLTSKKDVFLILVMVWEGNKRLSWFQKGAIFTLLFVICWAIRKRELCGFVQTKSKWEYYQGKASGLLGWWWFVCMYIMLFS